MQDHSYFAEDLNTIVDFVRNFEDEIGIAPWLSKVIPVWDLYTYICILNNVAKNSHNIKYLESHLEAIR